MPRLRYRRSKRATFLLAGLWLLLLAGCRTEIRDQPKIWRPLSEGRAFGSAARHPPSNTVAQDSLRDDEARDQGLSGEEPVEQIPLEVTMALLERGQDRYNVFCANCHGLAGYGDGPVVQNGFPPPPPLHEERLREAPDGRIYRVITEGYGVMFSYASYLPPDDRWAVVAYVRALQLSQNAPADELPDALLEQLKAAEE